MTEVVTCPHCGGSMQVTPEARGKTAACPHCGQQLSIPTPAAAPPRVPPMARTPEVPTYLVWAILATLFCCLPLGIVAIVYSAHVDAFLSVGSVAEAAGQSRKARTWCWIAFLVGLVSGIVSLASLIIYLGTFVQAFRGMVPPEYFQ